MHKRPDRKLIPYFKDFAVKAEEYGIKDWILDPGFGFAKTVEQNYEVLSGLPDIIGALRDASPRILIGVSRKSMIYKPLGITPEEALPATQAVHMAALMAGADILRVHDVREARQTAALYNLLNS
jgi:dihydropteroate synthase